MWTLVRKDLILDRRIIALNYAMYLILGPVFMSVVSQAPPRLVAVWAGIVGAMIPLSLLGREDKFGSAALTCSLPVTRDAVVDARFAGGWLLAGLGALGILGVCWAAALAGLATNVSGWAGAPLAAFVTVGLVLAVLQPFTTRFGLAGLVGFLVFTQVLGIVAFLVAVLAGGHAGLRVWVGGAVDALRSLGESLGSPGLALALVVVVVAANGASLLLCRWIYRRREI